MITNFKIIKLLLLIALVTGQLLALPAFNNQASKSNKKHLMVFKIEQGFYEDGAVTQFWMSALQYLRRNQDVSIGSFNKKMTTINEGQWAKLIAERINSWPSMVDSLGVPFRGIKSPDIVTILLGNQGGEDAFVYSDSIICFDLSRLFEVYGPATEPANIDRIDRFFAHEYTHILHKAWRKRNPIVLISPLDHALWECLTEGIGNYRSLSGKWFVSKDVLSEHAFSVLLRLQPVFVERILALEHATLEETKPLMKGLSMGPFDQKWGALTVALWLAQEVKGDETNLQQWVDAGPPGILLLAEKYLPENLKMVMPK